jgi:solute carrier family 6 GABA transporter-like protein 1
VTFGETYVYPKWAEIMGLCISFSSMIWVPIYVIYFLATTPGTLKERWIIGITPKVPSRVCKPAAEGQNLMTLDGEASASA